jgi:hypothetical protein
MALDLDHPILRHFISMGEANRKLNRRQTFLQEHPSCIYCGGRATTSDHCPPRTFFESRQWPETYEFPACGPCNESARLDEQALAVLIRCKLTKNRNESDQLEWQKLVRGVRNNQPYMITEWQDITRNETKRALRLAFGSEGDRRRQEGWGMANMGPLTHAIISRFMIKLSKALYYRHNHHIFDGVLYVNHINLLSRDTTPEYINSILKMAPALPEIERNRKSLVDQFIYRFNHSPEHRVMYAVVQFGEQFIFQLIAMGLEMDAKLVELNRGMDLSKIGRHECFLSFVGAKELA